MIVAYHRISSEDSRYSYNITQARFCEHLDVIANYQKSARESLPIVTFDDGEKSNYLLGVEPLQSRGVRAVFFVISSAIDSTPKFMSWSELKELVSLRHEVQSHGWSHKPLTDCLDAELRDELVRSKEVLENRLGVPVNSISVPHGRWDERVLQACCAAGYRRVYMSNPWIRRQELHGVEVVGRYMIRRSLEAEKLRRLLAGNRSLIFYLRSQYMMKEAVKHLMGHDAYRRMWRRMANANETSAPKVVR